MAAEQLNDIGVTHLTHPRGGNFTRLSWRGWHVDLDGQRVTVPTQISAGKSIEDLDALLRTGYRMLNIPIGHRARVDSLMAGRLPDALVEKIIEILWSAQHRAASHCGPAPFDVYQCTRRAWEDADMAVPYALLLSSLRAVLPPAAGSLADYTDTAGPAATSALYGRAIDMWCGHHPTRNRPATPRIA